MAERNLQKEGAALLEKWERTGLLEGLGADNTKQNMARLLENQAKQLLKEASAMSRGDVEGFASVAFPIVRRVFGGLIANDLVSVQPMSLPSGLIFFLDFTHTDTKANVGAVGAGLTETSIYGQGVVGSQLTGGVSLGEALANIEDAEAGFYALNNGYSSPTESVGSVILTLVDSGTVGDTQGDGTAARTLLDRRCRFDADLVGRDVVVASFTGSAALANMNIENLISIGASRDTGAHQAQISGTLVRRLTEITSVDKDPTTANFQVVFVSSNATKGLATTSGVGDNHNGWAQLSASIFGSGGDGVPLTKTNGRVNLTYSIADNFNQANALGAVVGATPWGLEGAGSNNATNGDLAGINADIPEIDIKVDSIAVTAITKKLKAKWTPELGQDLNAYHNLDAEVELTSVLSEQIGLEIDRELLNDLVQGATAQTLYWSRKPGKFLNRQDGTDVSSATAPPDFTGNVSEWYETLVETINDVSAQIHRKTLRGGANFIVTSPEVANLLEFTAGFRANVTHDSDKGTVGAVNVGSLSKKFDVYVDPYFMRNLILVGRKGGSFLESGYVYAPYVPLQVTPTIFGTEDFVPRKGVMTRYAKKMVRPDMYGLVVCVDLVG